MKNKAEFTKKEPMTEKSFTGPISLLQEKTGSQRNSVTCPSLYIWLMMGPALELTSPGISTGILNTQYLKGCVSLKFSLICTHSTSICSAFPVCQELRPVLRAQNREVVYKRYSLCTQGAYSFGRKATSDH